VRDKCKIFRPDIPAPVTELPDRGTFVPISALPTIYGSWITLGEREPAWSGTVQEPHVSARAGIVGVILHWSHCIGWEDRDVEPAIRLFFELIHPFLQIYRHDVLGRNEVTKLKIVHGLTKHNARRGECGRTR
jgi:hypothetical protein